MVKSILNNSSIALSAGSSFVGAGESVSNNVEISVSIKSDRNCLVRVEQSVDKTFWDAQRDFNYLTAGGSKNYSVGVVHQYVRVSVVNNSGVTMSYLRMATSFNEEYSSSVAVGTDASGIERKIAVDEQGKLLMTFVGEVGAQGKSAYQVAVDEGFVGTESAWLLTLKGIQGNQGIQGVTGIQGIQGLAGNDGSNGVDGSAGSDGVDGEDGLSSYQVWLGLGNSGTQEQFIQSLKGASILVKGTLTTAEILALNIATLSFGDSYFSSDAYTLYVFDGSTWVSSGSLRGMTGASGSQGIQGIQGEEGANVLVLGNVATASALPIDAEVGHAYFVNDTYSLSVSRGPGLWASSTSLRGPDGLTGGVGPTGPPGSVGPGVVAKGSVSDVSALNALPTPAVGDLYIVEADYKMYIYDGSAFQNSGVSMRGTAGLDGTDGLQGIQGIQGTTGSVGLTGNSILVMGNVATASALPTGYDSDDAGKAWFVVDTYVMSVWDGSAFQSSASLRGPQGEQGIQGVQGDAGADGADGTSLNFLGSVADASALATASSGWGASDLNKAYFQTDIFALQVWNGSAFVATTSIRGEQGIQGDRGITGFSFQLVASQTEAAILVEGGFLGASDQGKVYYGTDTYKLYAWNGASFITTQSIRGATGDAGADGADGADGANLLAKGNVADASALSAKVGTALAGDMWFQDDTFTANVFDGTAFQSSGSLRGPAGAAGADASLATPSIVTYSVASGTDGGAAAGGSGAWSTRPLNGLTNASSNGGVSLNTNVITIASTGTFKVEFMGVVHAVGHHKVRLLRINGGGGTIGVGQNDNASNGNSGHSHNIVTANFVAGDQLRLEHWVENAAGAVDLGAAVSSGEVELYARVVIEKLD